MNPLAFLVVAGVFAVAHHHVKRNPSAEDDSFTFHGEHGEVKGGRMIVGEIESIKYRPPSGSQRSGVYEHRFGDGGSFAPSSKRKPLLVEKNGKIGFSQGKSPSYFDSRYGLMR